LHLGQVGLVMCVVGAGYMRTAATDIKNPGVNGSGGNNGSA